MPRRIVIAHSPDSDDAFMFYAFAAGKVDTKGYEFDHYLQDIQTLNTEAEKGRFEISAVSIHAFPYIADKYALMSCGASMGDNYGPMVVTRKKRTPETLNNITVAVPGLKTSAYLALKLWNPDIRTVVMPFDKIMKAVENGEVEAGLIIHEGQLTWKDRGLYSVINLGEWWYELTGGLPLPLGGNVVRRDLGKDVMHELNTILREAIRYSIEHKEEALRYAMKYAGDLNKNLAGTFVSMYVNDLTIDYGERGREAIRRFLTMAHEIRLIPFLPEIDFV
jgi:1,4-dihydroxy-6-naphthoate synthase